MTRLINSSIILLTFCTMNVSGQSKSELEILRLSKEIFKWEVEDKVDSLEYIFHERFVVVDGSGDSQNKKQYITTLRGGNFIHNSVEVEESIATVADNTATIMGKGEFTVTLSGNKISLRLSYMEVFTRPNPKKPWKILAMHATVLQN